MTGNWLQRLLHWYWITPWQVALVIALMAVVFVWAFVTISRMADRVGYGVGDTDGDR